MSLFCHILIELLIIFCFYHILCIGSWLNIVVWYSLDIYSTEHNLNIIILLFWPSYSTIWWLTKYKINISCLIFEIWSWWFEICFRGDDDYMPGNILEIELCNFMTFDYLKCKPGPRLNLVIGPNGSGKSSLVCAIALGLCGEPKVGLCFPTYEQAFREFIFEPFHMTTSFSAVAWASHKNRVIC
jgi:hypothetical protein